MRECPNCGVENPPEARFCTSCAVSLATGEVVVGGEGETLVTGDAVNVSPGSSRRPLQGTCSWVRFALAEILQRRGRPAEAGTLAGEALSIHGAKGDVTGAARLREYLDRLGIAYGA